MPVVFLKSPSVTTPLRSSTTWPTWAQRSPATPLWMLSWMCALASRRQLWLVAQRVFGATPCWWPTQRWVLYSTEEKHGPSTPLKNAGSVSSLPQTTSGHHLARSHYQQGCLGSGKDVEHICHANTEKTVLAETHLPHGQWQHSKGWSVWWVGHCLQTHRTACTAQQRHLSAQTEGRQRQSNRPWNSILRPRHLVVHHEGRHQRSRTEERDQMGRMPAKETAETTFSTQQHPGQHVYLQQLQQILPL